MDCLLKSPLIATHFDSHPHSKKIIISSIYRLPGDNLENYKTFIKNMNEILNDLQQRNSEVVISGDFNIDFASSVLKGCKY